MHCVKEVAAWLPAAARLGKWGHHSLEKLQRRNNCGLYIHCSRGRDASVVRKGATNPTGFVQSVEVKETGMTYMRAKRERWNHGLRGQSHTGTDLHIHACLVICEHLRIRSACLIVRVPEMCPCIWVSVSNALRQRSCCLAASSGVFREMGPPLP